MNLHTSTSDLHPKISPPSPPDSSHCAQTSSHCCSNRPPKRSTDPCTGQSPPTGSECRRDGMVVLWLRFIILVFVAVSRGICAFPRNGAMISCVTVTVRAGACAVRHIAAIRRSTASKRFRATARLKEAQGGEPPTTQKAPCRTKSRSARCRATSARSSHTLRQASKVKTHGQP